ncbi:MAG TPA: helix-turn-helix transcriptional regulator [Candidatus Eisenbacteria bacterium]|jgi:transcriptional regulator with XRE-family HTH domain
MATFRARLRKARTVRKVTLAALAKTLGTYSTNVSAWQNGKTQPGLGYLVGLADALDVTTDWLTGRSDRGGPRRRK